MQKVWKSAVADGQLVHSTACMSDNVQHLAQEKTFKKYLSNFLIITRCLQAEKHNQFHIHPSKSFCFCFHWTLKGLLWYILYFLICTLATQQNREAWKWCSFKNSQGWIHRNQWVPLGMQITRIPGFIQQLSLFPCKHHYMDISSEYFEKKPLC